MVIIIHKLGRSNYGNCFIIIAFPIPGEASQAEEAMDTLDDNSSTQSLHSSASGETPHMPNLPTIHAPRGHTQRVRGVRDVYRAQRGHAVRTRGGRRLQRMVGGCGLQTRGGRAPQYEAGGHNRPHVHDGQPDAPVIGQRDNANDGRQQADFLNEWIWANIQPNGNYRPRDTPFQEDVGLTIPVPQDALLYDYFKLYLTREIIQKIVQETNRYAEQYLRANDSNIRRTSLVKNWKPTTGDEIQTFLGLCILMGLIYKPRIWMYWSTDVFYSTPLFSQVMSRERFQFILRFLHFQNNEDPNHNPQDPARDRLFKIRPMLDMFHQRLKTVYKPPEHIAVDESLVLFKGRVLFKQYIKSKRARFGTKFYELATSDGILLDFIIYQGNMEPLLVQPVGEGWLLAERIPLTPIDPYLNKGHTLIIDNMYTTPILAKYLLRKSTKVVGTIRTNRKNFPKDFPAAFRQHLNILAMKYTAAKDKAQGKPKVVHMLSTKHDASMKDTHRRNAAGELVQKPEAILYYNHKMGGVDQIDQQLHSMQVMRKTYKWYQKVFFRLMMMSLLSSQMIYKSRGGKHDFMHFIHDVISGMITHLKQDPRKAHDNLVRLTGRHFPSQSLYEGAAKSKKHSPKWCRVCTARGIKTAKGHPIRSMWQCADCPGNPGLCPGNCFQIYHIKIDYYDV